MLSSSVLVCRQAGRR